MNNLAQKYIQPIPVFIVGVCMLLGILIASIQNVSGWDSLAYVFGCIIMGSLFSHGYIAKKPNIFFWAIIGIGLKIFIVGVQGENKVMIADLLLEAARGAFVGLWIEKNARGVGIGALVLGLLAFMLSLLPSSNGELNASSELINNQLVEKSTFIVQWAWWGAFSGGLISSSHNSKEGKQMKTIKM